MEGELRERGLIMERARKGLSEGKRGGRKRAEEGGSGKEQPSEGEDHGRCERRREQGSEGGRETSREVH